MVSMLNVASMKSPILIISPHPDDEILCAGGLIQRAEALGKKVYVLFLTNGEAFGDVLTKYLHIPKTTNNYIKLGNLRRNESIRADAIVGLNKKRLFFLGFPERGTLPIAVNNSFTNKYRSFFTHFTSAAFPNSFVRYVPYNKTTAIRLIQMVLIKVKPGTVILNRPEDTNPDHKAARLLTLAALKGSRIKPAILSYMIHYPRWPSPKCFLPPTRLLSRGVRCMRLTKREFEIKRKAFLAFRSQLVVTRLYNRLVKPIEYFWIGADRIR